VLEPPSTPMVYVPEDVKRTLSIPVLPDWHGDEIGKEAPLGANKKIEHVLKVEVH
jgi:hypothetical protein